MSITPPAASQPAPTDWYAGITEKHFDLAIHKAVQRDRAARAPADSGAAPIDMVLHCPKCGLQHIDAPEQIDRRLAAIDPPAAWAMDPWTNEPHRSHLCHGHGCGHIWRPADVPTNGVAAVKTTGKADSPIAARAQADSVTAPAGGAVAGSGWKWVPKILSDEMVDAWASARLPGGISQMTDNEANRAVAQANWDAMIAAAPTPPAQAQAGAVPLTDREIELIDGMIQVHLDHASRCDAIANRSMADKQKGWDMERVALLQKIKTHGIKGGQHGADT